MPNDQCRRNDEIRRTKRAFGASSFEHSGFFRHSSFDLCHWFVSDWALKNLESTTMRQFAMKIPGHLGLNKNLNRKRLWTGKNSSSHSLQRLVFFSSLDSSGTGCSCMARIRKSQRFYEA